MKILKIVLITVLVLIIAGLTWATISYNFYSPKEVNTAPDKADLKYFRESYEKSRDAFRTEAKSLAGKYKAASQASFNVPSKNDKDLTVDMLYIPALKNKKGLIIISSGVHGVEGFTGSAVQRMMMEEFMTNENLASTGFLFIHGMNPYGFKNSRRVTGNNIDLNRNSSPTDELYKTKNTGYPAVMDLINPQESVNTASVGNIFFELRAIRKIISAGMPVLRQAILQGQYEFPKGIFYGGSAPEPQIKSVTPFIKKFSAGYPLVMNIDLHTGYGERGTLHLFPDSIKDKKIRAMMEKVFDGYRIDWGDSKDFYTVTGDFPGHIGKIITPGAFLPMSFEYGTLDSQTTVGSIKSLHTTILENQGVNFGYKSDKNKAEVEKNFREMYFPSSPAWRTKVIKDSRIMTKKALQQFREL
jgi:hypothetical protein